MKLAQNTVDAVRRRVQQEQTGHRGHKMTRSTGFAGSCCAAPELRIIILGRAPTAGPGST